MPPSIPALRARLRHSIRARLIAMTCLIVVGVITSLTLVIALAAAGMLRQGAERHLAQNLEQSAALMSNFLAVRESNLNLWAANPLSEAMFSDPALAAVFSPSLGNYFASARAREPWISHILLMRGEQVVYDDSGAFQTAPGAAAVSRWLKTLPYGGVAVLDLKRLNGRSAGQALVLKRPLIKEGAALKGAFIALLLDLNQVQAALFQHTLIGDHGFVAVAAELPGGGVALPARIEAGAESQTDFRDATRRLSRLADLPPQFGSLVIRQRVLPHSPIAIVGVASRNDISEPIARLILYSGACGLLALLAGAFCAIVYSERLTQPILELAQAARALKLGNLTDPIRCASEDEIGQLAQSLETTRQALAGLVADLERRVSQRTWDLSQKTEEVAQLLDNSGQGFLSCGANLLVNTGYSRECARIFGQEIQGRPLPELLAPSQAKQREFIAKTLRLAIASDDELRRDAYLSLLPAEYLLSERSHRAEYRPLSQGRMMLVLTDISAQKKLQARLAGERQWLAFIVNALENRDELLEILRDFDDFRRRSLPDLLSFQQDASILLAELFRRIHTFKGLFAQASLPMLPRALHALEDRLSELREGDAGVNDIKRILAEAELGPSLEADLAVLREKLGADYLQYQRQLRVPVSTLNALTVEVETRCGTTSRLAALVRQLRYEPLRRLIEPHFKAAQQLALRQGKLLVPLRCKGDDPLVDPVRYGAFCKTLIHVFRNAVDHGIEDPDTRLLADKSEAAAIECRIEAAACKLVLSIEDDGRGIDPAAVRAAARARGLLAADAEPDEAETLRLVLADGLSTHASPDALSGRGVGLSACYQELLRLGGELHIASAIGRGARLTFSLPYEPPLKLAAEAAPLPENAPLLDALAQVATDFCQRHLGLDVAMDQTGGLPLAASDLLDFTALVPLGSGLNLAMGISLERPLLREMTRRFEPDCGDAEIAQLADSVGAEIANIIVGRTTPYLTHLAHRVAMGTPEVLGLDASRLLDRAGGMGRRGRADAGRFLVFCLPLPA
ncbi:ATP-binding protein [Chromobacterium alticapitis]|uniref:histidine kinase n=1 Tax=Chromobacterium alticapitis TaxID=2073169 RepID=A0A2S5DGW7_9NEIS|nr:ATP-binding protein [Chromobacterium alticapitis]POZ62238.1 hypothetical protein C2I19_09515 [Chromobacterium alticapitis]